MSDKRYDRNRNSRKDDYDGVVYEPSEEARQFARSKNGVYRNDKTPRRTTPRRREQPRSQFALFYVVTLLVGVIICMVIFAIVLGSFTKDDKPNASPGVVTPAPSPNLPEVQISELDKLTGVISDIDNLKSSFKVVNMDNGNIRELIVQAETLLKDQYGSEILYSDFKIGDIVEASFDNNNNRLETFSISAASWEKRLVKDVYVDAEKGTIAYGNEVRSYDSNTIVTFNKLTYDIAGVSPIDIVTMRGMRDKLWYLEVNKSHGYMKIEGGEDIKDGIIEVDTGLYQKLNESESLEVLEGPHKIIVRGANIDLFTKNVTIVPGETITLDLTEAVFKTGLLSVSANVTDYLLKINGEEVSPGEPISLDIGDHLVTIDKEGYEPFEKTITMTEAPQQLVAELKKIEPEPTPENTEVAVKTSRIYITTEPDSADIYIDNVRAGTSPLQANVSYGQHTLIVRKTGYIDVGMNINLTDPEHRYLIPMRLKPTPEPEIGTGPMATPTPDPNQPEPVMP